MGCKEDCKNFDAKDRRQKTPEGIYIGVDRDGQGRVTLTLDMRSYMRLESILEPQKRPGTTYASDELFKALWPEIR